VTLALLLKLLARLTYRHHGRDERLTDVYEARLLQPLLA